MEVKYQRLIDLTIRAAEVRDIKDTLISIYTNASGYLWQLMKVDSGTDLGWCGFNGDCEMSGSSTSYENALEDALNLIDKCSYSQFRKLENPNKFHWGNYAEFLNKRYRIK